MGGIEASKAADKAARLLEVRLMGRKVTDYALKTVTHP